MEIQAPKETLVTQAVFARLLGVSRKTVTVWKAEGRIAMVGGKVDFGESVAKLLACGRLRDKIIAQATPIVNPFAFADAITDPAQRLSVIRAMTIAYDAPAVAAVSALEAGCSLKDIYLLYTQMRVSLFEWTCERLIEWGCEPLASDEDAPICFPGAFKEPIWLEFAKTLGEAFTPERWDRQSRSH